MADNCTYWKNGSCLPPGEQSVNRCSFHKRQYENCNVMRMFCVRAAGGSMADEDFAMGIKAGLPGRKLSDRQIQEVVAQIRHAERIADEIKEGEARKRLQEEARQAAENRAAEAAAEEARRKPIREYRIQNGLCPYCGEPFGFFDKIFKRSNHKRCTEGNGKFLSA